MTIDRAVSNMLESLNRIAEALEAIVESQGIVTGTLPPAETQPETKQPDLPLDNEDEDDDLSDMDDDETDDDLGDDDDEDLEDEDEPSRKKKKPPAKKKKKSAKKKKIGREPEVTSEYSAEDVREALKNVQIATGSAAQPKSILKKNGASTFGQLQVGRYDQVIAACEKLLEEY